uniref:RagB/SusD family nutrient uptake outer membrane protein n=1 Tax=Prevotella sp. TaxID=59823 RepID=UPI003FED4E2C
MKKTYSKYIALTLLAASLGLSSCDSFLDELPDNRMELKGAKDITDLLVSAYPEYNPAFLLERYSDNSDQFDVTGWNDGEQFEKEAYNWKDITDISAQEAPQNLWENFYHKVGTANLALQAIEKQGDPSALNAQRGEALLCRAYSEFMLANVFCNAYSPTTADKELGLPFPTEPEEHVGTKYQRGTLKQLYDKINSDIEEALPLVQDDQYTQPKFHFTRAAAYAFAAKFNLFYGNYEKAISYADQVLGANAANGLRNWASFYALSPNGQVAPNGYVSSSEDANLLILAAFSEWGVYYGPYGIGNEFSHSKLISSAETLQANGPWGNSATFGYTVWSNNSLSKYFINKIPYSFEYKDIQAGTGFAHTEMPAFTTDGTLLVRAEAKALNGDYAGAVSDLNLEVKAMSVGKKSVTLDAINSFYDGLDDYTPTVPTPKKALHPVFTTLKDNTQQNVIDAILQLRRILTLGEGERMQDVKRYGIVIYRRKLNRSSQVLQVTDSLTQDDPRRAIQLPQDVITAGLQANPRNK